MYKLCLFTRLECAHPDPFITQVVGEKFVSCDPSRSEKDHLVTMRELRTKKSDQLKEVTNLGGFSVHIATYDSSLCFNSYSASRDN